MARLEPLRSAAELAPLDWITTALDRFGKLLPDGYPAYARILHPAEELVGDAWRPVRWAQVAARTGRVIHPLVQFPAIAPAPPTTEEGHWADPWQGELPDGQLAALIPLLVAATGTPSACTFCVWDGYGDVTGAVSVLTAISDGSDPGPQPPKDLRRPGLDELPRLRLPGRDYVVLRGPVEAATQVGVEFLVPPYGSRVGPNLWWPDDRAWVVASEIDLDSTYVAGSRRLIDAILAEPALEALESWAGAPITIDSDTVNA